MNTTNAKQTVTLDFTKAYVDEKNSQCGQNASDLVLGLDNDTLTMNFVNENGEKSVKSIVLNYVPNKDVFPGHPHIGKELLYYFYFNKNSFM